MRIVQIAPDIGPGSGVAGVAYNLELEWRRRGIETARFTMREARGDWLPAAGRAGIRGKLALMARVVWFSTVGTVLARRFLRSEPGAVSICHNDVLAGDVYVNHGIVQAAMSARGSYHWRMLRNPLHRFTALRDTYRYGRFRPHRLVVNLVTAEETLLREAYPALRTPTVVIGNGVDTSAFAPADDQQRRQARSASLIAADDVALLFVGHEFDRKGLTPLLESLALVPENVRLIVVGGSPDLVARAGATADALGVASRVHFVGPVADPRPYFQASDVFVLPSAYESYGLVVLEALASGLPVIATPTGCVPDLITSGVNGFVVEPSAADIARAVVALAGVPRDQLARAARSTAEGATWSSVADRYLDALTQLGTAPVERAPRP
jgi:UDP-glucose:(heptosyl)LPS alpha-1,3-glucosyltransferase